MKNLFYFDWRTWWTMVRLVRREPAPARRRRQYRTLCVVVPALAVLHTVTFALDPIFYPALRRTEVRSPVFVVGHARSGTTYLHRMMANDPRFSYVLLWEMFFPSLLEKKMLRAVLRWDKRLGGRLRRRVDALDERLFSKSQSVHESGLFAPEEDEFLLTLSCASGFWVVQYPHVQDLDFYYVDDRWPATKRRRVMQFYKECVRRQLVLNGPGLMHLSKAPIHCGRVESLIETFPDARFVVPVRNLRDDSELSQAHAVCLVGPKAVRARHAKVVPVLRGFVLRLLPTPTRCVGRPPAGPECDRGLQRPRDQPGRDDAPRVRRDRDRHGAGAREGAGRREGPRVPIRHTYEPLEEFGLEADEIRTRLARLFDRFGWESDRAS